MQSSISRLIAALALMLGIFVIVPAATATGDDCVPSDAWTETINHPEVSHEETITVVDQEAWTETIPAVAGQHYSWNGGRLPTTSPPTVVPDDTDPDNPWQANTSQEPHDNGQGNPATWVNDSLHYTANSQGHASWFYYVHPVPEQVIEHPAVTHEETITVVDEEAWTETIEHPAVVCEDEQPDPLVVEASSPSYECGDDFATVTTTVTTTEYVSDGNGGWVLGEPVTETTTAQVPHEVEECPVKNPPTEPPTGPEEGPETGPGVLVATTSSSPDVPSAVDAGLGTVSTSEGRSPAPALAVLMGALLIGAALLRRIRA